MRRAIVWLFSALVITVPFAFTAVNEELFEFNKMMLVYAYTSLIAGLWLVRMIRAKKIIFQRTLLFWPIIFFLTSQLLSTVTSIHVATSIFGYYSRFHGGLLSTLAYLTLYFAAVSNLDRHDLKPLVRSVVYAGIGVALYALPEHFGVSPSCVLITGEFSVSCWVQDVQTRVFGTLGQPNWLAAYLIMLLPLSLWLWQQSRTKLERWLSAASIPLFFTVLLFTGSRSGLLGFVASGAVWLRVSPSRRGIAQGVTLLASFVILALLFGTPFTPTAFKWIARFSPSSPPSAATIERPAAPSVGTVLENGGTNSGAIRQIVWSGALAVWQRYPLFGSGVETFAYSYYRDRPLAHNTVSEWNFLYNKAHNEFLNALATTGAVGLIALLTLMGAVIWQLLRRHNTLATAILASYLALAVSNFFGFSTVTVGVLFFLMPAWIFINEIESAATSRLEGVTLKRDRISDEWEVELDGSSLLTLVVGLATGLALLSVCRTWANDRLLAQAKRQVLRQQPLIAYQLFQQLTQRASREALYWDEAATFMANLATAAAPTDATIAAQLGNEAIAATNRAVTLNPVHLSFWKSRAKVFLYLAKLDPRYYDEALAALEQAAQLAPTDPQIYFNRAVILGGLHRNDDARAAFTQAITLKPNYEEARHEFGQFLESAGDWSAAVDQYQKILQLKPGEEFATERLKVIEASISGKRL